MTILFILLPLLIIIVSFFVLFLNLKHSKKKTQEKKETKPSKVYTSIGQIGEEMVFEALEGLLKKEYGFLFKNFCFEYDYDRSNEIDAIFICRGGIFVLEIKYMKGKIGGRIELEEWNCFPKNPYSGPKAFRNPIQQNQAHIRHLCSLFSATPPKMVSMIVFSQGDISNIHCPEVYTLASAMKKIQGCIEEKKYSKKFVDKTYRQIQSIQLEYGIDRKKHLENLKNIKKDYNC